jgi:pentapeptide MXKDX repeat protein
MKHLLSLLIAGCMTIGASSAIGQNSMDKDAMARDAMSRDSMGKQSMGKDAMHGDAMRKDAGSTPERSKAGGGMERDSM